MSLLSSTQGTPERTLSLVQVLAAHDGRLPRGELLAWLDPAFGREASEVGTSAAADQTLGSASSLDFASVQSGHYVLEPGLDVRDLDQFADITHQRLLTLPPDKADSVLLRAFAYIVARTEQARGTGWLHASTNKVLADGINKAFPERANTGAEGRIFNEYKMAPFWRWIGLVGLAVNLPTNGYHPSVSVRLARELGQSGLTAGQELPIRQVLEVIAERMPYMDGGRLFNAAAEAIGLAAQGRSISPVLSTALRDLDEEGVLTLGFRQDAPGLISLADDRYSRIKSVQFVTLKPQMLDA
jgi:hypothetical protein